MTLDEHLAKGYDLYQHGKGPWSRAAFGAELKENADLLAEARVKLKQLQSVLSARPGSCHVSQVQVRVLGDGIRTASA